MPNAILSHYSEILATSDISVPQKIMSQIKHYYSKLREWLGFSKKPHNRRPEDFPLHVLFSESRIGAKAALADPAVIVVLGSNGHYKWAQMNCPCGCGEVLALNLMPAHKPVWEINIKNTSRFSIRPSVDSTSCGAHFWITDGKIKWVL